MIGGTLNWSLSAAYAARNRIEEEWEMAETTVPVHPVQVKRRAYGETSGHAPQTVTMKAYEVYCEVYSPQEALVTGGCRGGFSSSDIYEAQQ